MSLQAYVSYSWGVDDKAPIVAELKKLCDERGILLNIDKNDVGYAASIPKFMHEIGDADWVFVILSLEYCQSEYCMFEWLRICERVNFPQGVLPILVSRDWLDGTELAKSNKAIKATWTAQISQAVTVAIADPAFANEHEKLRRIQSGDAADALIDWVARPDLRAPGGLAITPVGNAPAGSPILRKLVEVIPQNARLKHDKNFVDGLKQKILQHLKDNAVAGNVAPLLQQQAVGLDEAGVDWLIANPETGIDKVLVSSHRAAFDSLQSRTPDRERFWRSAEAMIARLLMAAISREALIGYRSPLSAAGKATSQLRLPVKSAFGAAAFAGRRQQNDSYEIVGGAGSPRLSSAGVVDLNEHPHEWDEAGAMNKILVLAWNKVYPTDRKEGKANVSDMDLEYLQKDLELAEENPSGHYFLFVPSEHSLATKHEAVWKTIEARLPALIVIFVDPDLAAVNLLSAPELRLAVSVRKFLMIGR